jgi:hypothetical protein
LCAAFLAASRVALADFVFLFLLMWLGRLAGLGAGTFTIFSLAAPAAGAAAAFGTHGGRSSGARVQMNDLPRNLIPL